MTSVLELGQVTDPYARRALEQLSLQEAGGGGGGGVGPPGPAGPPGGTYSTTVIGDDVATSFVVTHGLATRNVQVAVYRNSAPYDQVGCDVERTDANTVTIRLAPSVPSAGEYIVLVSSAGSPGSGSDANYVHMQSVPSATWTVIHSLGKYPAVDVVDSGDSLVIPDVHYDSVNQATLVFGSPTSGRAFCN